MSERTYSQDNTGISVREASFLSPVSLSSCLQVTLAKAEKSCCKERPMR